MASKASTLSEGSLYWSKADDSLMDAVGKKDVVKVRSMVNKKKANPTKISPHLGVAAIHQAASFDKPDILDALLMFPTIDVNATDARKRAAIHHAVREGRDECLNRLILMNANTMLVENEGLTALHLASMHGHLGCLHLLVSTVRSVDAKDDKQRTALFYAASRGSASSCRLLLEYGANINATDNYGRTALMMTAEKGHHAAFQYLLTRGANFYVRDKKGRDIRWYATNYNHADLLLISPNAVDGRSISDTSNEDDEQLSPSSQKLAKKWGPELDLSRADPERTPRHQNQTQRSTTDSEQRSNSILEDEGNVRSVSVVDHQTQNGVGEYPNGVDEKREQEWTKERLELIEKLTDLAEENKELLQWKAKTEAVEQQTINLLTSQRQIYPLMEEVYQSVESCRRQSSVAEEGGGLFEENISQLQEASQKLTLILQSMYETSRVNAGPTDEIGNLFAEEMSRRDKVIGELESRVKEYDKEMERLETEIRRLNELTGVQKDRIEEQEEDLEQLQLSRGGKVIGELESRAKEYDKQMERLKAEVRRLNQMTNAQKDRIQEQEENLEKIQLSDIVIGELESRLKENDKHMERLEEEIRRLNELTNSQKDRIEEQEEDLEQLQMSRNDKVIGELESRVKEYDKEMERLEVEIRRLNELTNSQKDRIQEQDEDLEKLQLSRGDKVIGELESRAKEYDKEVERLEAEITRLEELTNVQKDRIQEQEEDLEQLQRKIRDQTVSLRRFSSVMEMLCRVTELDDVNEEQAADVIRQIAVEYQKLQTKYQTLKAKHREAKTMSSELHLNMSSTAPEVLTQGHYMDEDDWRGKTMQDLRGMKNLSGTPISDLLQEQLIVLRKSLESQIESAQRKDNFKNKADTWLPNQGPPVALQKSNSYMNSGYQMDEHISRGKEMAGAEKEVSSKSNSHFTAPQLSRTSDDHSLDEDERTRYEAEIRQLRRKIESLKLEDSGVRTMSTDVELDDDSHMQLMLLSQQEHSPVPDHESVGILTENRRLKSELEKLRSRIQPERSEDAKRMEQEVRMNSKGMQTDDELLKEVMLSRMASNYEKELLQKVESLKSQNAQLRSEIEAFSVQRNYEQNERETKASRVRSERTGGLSGGRDASRPSAGHKESRESDERRLEEESDSSSGESVESNGLNPGDTEKARKIRNSKAKGDKMNAKEIKNRKAENGGKRGFRDFDGRSTQRSVSQTSCSSNEEDGRRTQRKHSAREHRSLSQKSCSSNEENRKGTRIKHDVREHRAKKTKISTGDGNKNRNSARTSTFDETPICSNKSGDTSSSKPHDVILSDRIADGPLGDPSLLTAEVAQKILVKKLMNLPDSDSPLNSRGSPAAHVRANPSKLLVDSTKLEDAVVAKPSFPTHVSRPNASVTTAESSRVKGVAHNGKKTKTLSTRRRDSSSHSSYDEEAFESMFQVNQELVDPSKTSNPESTNQAKRKSKIQLLRFDAQARSKLETDLETVIQENTRLREEMSNLKAEISYLKRTASNYTAARVDVPPSPASAAVEIVGKRRSVASKGVDVGQPVTSKRTSTVQYGVSLRRHTASEEEAKSQDEGGYRFLSEDEHGTFKFKEFSQQTPSLFGQDEEEEEKEDDVEEEGTFSSDDLSHSQSASSSDSSSLNSSDEAENDARQRRTNGGKRKRGEAREEGKLVRKVSNETQQRRRLNETVTLVATNRTELSGNLHQPQHQHLNQQQQQQRSSRKATQLHQGKGEGNRVEMASNSFQSQKEILSINRETLTDADKTQIFALQKQIQDSEKIYKAVIGTYRSHLLASIQGCLDSEVADALCRIVTLQNGRHLEY